MRKLGDGFVMMTSETAKALLSIEEEVNKPISPQGRSAEICLAAYNEIQLAYGNHKVKEICCGKWAEIRKGLTNWIKMYKERGRVDQLRINPPEVKKLQPLKERQSLKPKEVKKEKTEKELLQEELDKLGIKYHHKAGVKKLKELLTEAKKK